MSTHRDYQHTHIHFLHLSTALPHRGVIITVMQLSPGVSILFFTMSILLLSPSLQPTKSSHVSTISTVHSPPTYTNSPHCPISTVHVSLTLDKPYLRGSVAAVHSILHHSLCPHHISFHFLLSDPTLQTLIQSTFPNIRSKFYFFDPNIVKNLISTSVRRDLEQPLNYARNYLSEILENDVERVIYLDSDLIVVDDIEKLWRIDLEGKTIGAPEYCHANFTKYFTSTFWGTGRYASVFSKRKPCYFNTGVMVIDLVKWRKEKYTSKIERWMMIQKEERIYELGSLPPFLLVFAGHVAGIDHRWNQHGLGGDNVKGSCRDLHKGAVSLLHWSGSGKPWLRLDARKPCPLDYLWSPYDLFGQL